MTPVDTKRPTDTQRVYNQSLEREFLKKLYDVTTLGKEVHTSQHQMAELTGVPSNVVSSVMRVMRDNKIYTRRFEFNPTGPSTGRKAFWTIDKPYEEAYHALMSDQTRRNERISLRNKAISNSIQAKKQSKDQEKPPVTEAAIDSSVLAQARVWAKSAQNYMHQIDEVTAAIERLKSLGMEVDEDAIYAATKLRHDQKLADIALVIPYIEHLEKSVKNLQSQFNKKVKLYINDEPQS